MHTRYGVVLPVVSVKLESQRLRLTFPFRSAVLQTNVVVIVKQRLKVTDEIVQHDSCNRFLF